MKHLILILALALSAQAQTTKIITPGSLVCYYPFGEGSGTTTADLGSGFTSTFGAGGAAPTWTNGLLGSCLLFGSGGTTYSDCGAHASLKFSATSPFSVTFWMFPTTISGGTMIDYDGVASSNGWGVFLSSSTVNFRYANTSSNLRTATSANITASVWTHVAGVWDGAGTASVYVNTVKTSNTTSVGTPSGTPTYPTTTVIGARSSLASSVAGSVDDLKIYNRALSQAEVNYLYYAKRQQPYGSHNQ